MQLFVDMDGVLADFDTHHGNVFGISADKTIDNVNWQKIAAQTNFYANIPPMPDMLELWNFIRLLKPIVLTGIPSSVPEAADNKRGWIAKHLGSDVEVRCCASKDKCLHAGYGDILIDDWDKYKNLWLAQGGRWITHVSAKTTIEQLLYMGIGSRAAGF